MYEWMGRAHAWIVQERGQGTVEYVGLILLLGVILAGVVTAAGTFDEGERDRDDRGEEAQAAIDDVGGEE